MKTFQSLNFFQVKFSDLSYSKGRSKMICFSNYILFNQIWKRPRRVQIDFFYQENAFDDCIQINLKSNKKHEFASIRERVQKIFGFGFRLSPIGSYKNICFMMCFYKLHRILYWIYVVVDMLISASFHKKITYM